MKKLLIGILVLGSFSALASTSELRLKNKESVKVEKLCNADMFDKVSCNSASGAEFKIRLGCDESKWTKGYMTITIMEVLIL